MTALPATGTSTGREQRHGHRRQIDAVRGRRRWRQRPRSTSWETACVATAGGEPSPAGDPVSEAFGATKNGADQKWGWVKSRWLFPM